MAAATTPIRVPKGERTRARLLEIAIRRFAADGFQHTSVSDIARDAQLTPAAVYAYFDGKEALFEAAVDADAAALIGKAHVQRGSGTVRERLAAFGAALTAHLGEHPLAVRVLAGREPEVVGRLLRLPTVEADRAAFAAEIAVGQRAGDVRADIDPEVIALGVESIVLALLMGMVQAGVGPGSERPLAAAAVLDAALKPPE